MMGAVAANVDAHAALIQRANARLVVFPELSLTGYQLEVAPVDVAGPVVDRLVLACAATGCSALVGAPVEDRGRRYIAMVLVDSSGAEVVYRKTHLGAAEKARFRPGPAPQRSTLTGGALGWGYVVTLVCPSTCGAPRGSGWTCMPAVSFIMTGNSASNGTVLAPLPRRVPRRLPWQASPGPPEVATYTQRAIRLSGRRRRRW
ncbi:hydrolase, putative [Mycobacterium sp. 012931]|nr:hydrolase, putative [Mycobacterium sp. 012931]